MNLRSIQARLIFWYSGLIVLVALAFGAYVYHGVRERLYGEMEQTLVRRARHIAANMLPHLHDLPPRTMAAQIREVYSPEANGSFIRILRGDGSVLYVSGVPRDGLFNPNTIAMPAGSIPKRQRIALASGHSMLLVTVPASLKGQPYFIQMGGLTHGVISALNGLIVTLLVGLPAVVLIVAAGGYVLVRRSLQPVEDIRATAEKITFGNLSNRLPVAKTGDALEHLSLTLNQMLDRLEDAYQQARRFSADASHELRTPLAILRGELESIVREPQLPEELCERIGSVLEETEGLSRITEKLFAISRLDAGEARIQGAKFELAPLVQATSDQMALLAEEKHIGIRIVTDDSAPVYGDAARIKQIIVNLLDNAIKYTPEGGCVTLTVSATPTKAALEVRDNGVGIPAEALSHVFERFYRADKVRSRGLGGAGLGLAIVRSIVQAHGGSVDIQSTEGKGTSCRVELPLANERVDA